MGVNLFISGTHGGLDLPETNSLGSGNPAAELDTKNLYISHDGEHDLTDVSLYITRDVSSGYEGVDPDEDIDTILGWGDTVSTEGVQLNMVDDGIADWQPMKTTSGSVSSPIILIQDSIIGGHTVDGEIPANKHAHIQIKVVIPAAAAASKLGFTFVVAYSATS